MFSWEKLNCKGDIPTPRCEHTSVVWRGSLYVFAGAIKQDPNSTTCTNDLHELSLATSTWKKVNTLNTPSPRFLHSAVVHGDRMIIFGGWKSDSGRTNEVYSFDFLTKKWTHITTSGTIPSERERHSAVVDGDSMIIFGGRDNSRCLNDLLKLDLKTWTWSEIYTPTVPSPRLGHSVCIADKEMYVFGGYDGHSKLNDLHCLNLRLNSWKYIEVNGKIPTGRFGHSITIKNRILYLFGGVSTGFVNDLYALHLHTCKWKKVKFFGDAPAPRYGHSTALLDDNLIIFGGGGSSLRNDTHVFKLTPGYCLYTDATHLSRVLQNELLTDVQFVVGDTIFPAHKCIVSISKLILRKLQEADSNNEKTVKITDAPAPVFKKILQFLYTGMIQLDISDADIYVELIVISEKYGLENMKIMCIQQFDNMIHPENIVSVLAKAHAYNVQIIKILCINYFVNNRDIVLQRPELSNLDKELMIEVLPKVKVEKVPEIKRRMKVKTLKEHITELYDSKMFSDVELISQDGKRFKAHRVILAAFCEYFALMFKNSFKESLEKEIVMQDIDSNMLEMLLKLIYRKTVQLPSDIDSLLALISISDMLMMKDLNEQADKKLYQSLSADNALDMLQICVEWKVSKRLKDKCWNLINSMNKDKLVTKLLETQLRNQSELQKHRQVIDQLQNRQKLQDAEIQRLKETVKELTSLRRVENRNYKKRIDQQEEQIRVLQKQMTEMLQIMNKQ